MRRVWLLAALVLLAGCTGGNRSGPAYDDGTDTGGPSADGTDGNETDPAEQEPTDEDTDDGSEKNGSTDTEPPPEDVPMKLTSPAFEESATIPREHTGEGADTSPPLNVSEVPDGAETLALIADDPDAPREEPWVHWLIWDIPAAAETISEGYPPSGDGKAFDQAKQGTNSFSSENQRYRGPYPPQGDGEHRYRFTLFALDKTLGLEAGADRTQL